jgi:hypothetical protein
LIKKIANLVCLTVSLVSCGKNLDIGDYRPTPASTSKSSDGAGDSNTPQPLPIPHDAPTDHIHPNYLYPVTICGSAEATLKDFADSEYRIRNGSLVVYLKLITPKLKKRFKDLNGIFPSSASSCVHGRNLPVNVDGKLVFEVEKESLGVASGGFSVSN